MTTDTMTLKLERQFEGLRKEMQGIRALLMEVVDPDAGLELNDSIKGRIRRGRKSADFLTLDQTLDELKK